MTGKHSPQRDRRLGHTLAQASLRVSGFALLCEQAVAHLIYDRAASELLVGAGLFLLASQETRDAFRILTGRNGQQGPGR